MLRPIAAALSGLALTLLPLAPRPVGAAASPITGYTFAQSSLAGGGFENVIAADPRHNGVVLSGGDVSGIEESTDLGKTWVGSQNGTIDATYHPVAAIAFNPQPPYDVYAATNGGMMASTNDGVSWTPLPAGPDFNGSNTSGPPDATGQERCTGNLIAFDDARHLIYAASYNEGVWKYDTAARTWSTVAQQAQLGNAFCLTSLAWGPGRALEVATWGEGLFTIQDPSAVPTVQPVAGSPPVVQELAGLSDGDVWGAAYGTGVGVVTSAGWVTKHPSAGENYLSIAGYVTGGNDVVIAGSDNSPIVPTQPPSSLHAVLHETRD